MPGDPPGGDPVATGDEAALPIARRLAKAVERPRSRRFPLLWRPLADVERLPMVGWYEPRQLVDAGFKKVVSTIVGQRSDQRIVQALASRRREYYDYTVHYREGRQGPFPDRTRPREDIWIDYLADTGDGWNSTYAIAYAVAQPEVRVPDESGHVLQLPRANVLVFGGDEVYPTPSREEYHRRLIVPYEQAFGDATVAEAPHVFAIPGNHDWYDGLTAFARLFASRFGGRYFAGWRTRQRRSYFALKLPANWWLIGSDGQLQSDIDTPQIEYFRDIANRYMQPGDRVIVCLAAPVWIHAHKYRQLGGAFDETDLLYLRREVFERRGIRVQAFLAGDNHHYRRHVEIDPAPETAPVQKITSGGGGAFLHPTHDEDVATIEEPHVSPEEPPHRFGLAASYPDLRQSSRLTFGNLLFALRNPAFGIVPAVIYLMTVWMVSAAIVHRPPEGLADAMWLTAGAFRRNPSLTLWVAGVVIALVTFTDTHSLVYRWLGGLAHAGAHWSAMFALGWCGFLLSNALFPHWGPGRFGLVALVVGGGAWIIGSTIMGVYLLVSLNVFGRHSEQAFSALRIEDYKHFLRMHIAADGTLTIYPLKLDRVPRRWRPRQEGDSTASSLVPDDSYDLRLIEAPIVVSAANEGSIERSPQMR
jgi:hypothetical protein